MRSFSCFRAVFCTVKNLDKMLFAKLATSTHLKRKSKVSHLFSHVSAFSMDPFIVSHLENIKLPHSAHHYGKSDVTVVSFISKTTRLWLKLWRPIFVSLLRIIGQWFLFLHQVY